MLCRPKTKPRFGAIAVAAICGATLAGCSDLYLDRRDSIALSAGDAIAANQAAQTRDPWPAQSGNINSAFNGEKMQAAVERYRRNQVTQPVDPMMMQVATPTAGSGQAGSSQNSGGSANPAGTTNGSTAQPTTAPGQ